MNKYLHRLNEVLDSSFTEEEIMHSTKLVEILKDYLLFQNYNLDSVRESITTLISIMSDSVIESLSNYINWKYISHYSNLDEDFIEKYKYRLDWSRISKNEKLTIDIIDKYHSLINWAGVFSKKRNYINENTIGKLIKYTYRNKSGMFSLLFHQRLSESIIDKYWKLLDINYLSRFQELSFDFIEKHITELPIDIIFSYQKNISTDIIYKYLLEDTRNLLLIRLKGNVYLNRDSKKYIKKYDYKLW